MTEPEQPPAKPSTSDKVGGRRLFVGVRVSLATANALAKCADALARRARDGKLEIKWLPPTSYHVTLKFLGWTRADAIVAIRDRVATAIAGSPAFKFRTSKLGAFPSLDQGSVVWAGIEDPKPLAELADRIERAATELGFPAETRPFQPHVTLGRTRETRVLRELVLPMSEQMFSESQVDGVVLFESEIKTSSYGHKEISRMTFKPLETEGDLSARRQTGALELGDETDDGWPRGQGQ